MIKKQKGEKKFQDRKSLLLDDRSPFVVIEAYKALRTNVIFSLPRMSSRCIAITSSGRSEGKTTNIINLAISFGQLGKKVVLIDADMRLPKIAATLEMKSHPGLSDILVGEVEIEDAVYVNESRNIDVLPAGTIPPDPTKLLGSEKMKQVIDTLREKYDYILIDLPPVNAVTDALILVNLVDGFLLLVKHNATQHAEISKMIHQIQRASGKKTEENGKILGFLYVDTEVGSGKYYKKYGYSYGYEQQ